MNERSPDRRPARRFDVSRALAAAAKHAASAGLLGAALTLTIAGCQDQYPIEATRCDYLCDLTEATFCEDYNPAACVVGCEQNLGGSACPELLDDFIRCLEMHESELTCGGFDDRTVPECKKALDAAGACGMVHARRAPSSAE
ncbi:MAG TPA: hypothetical protein VJV79_17200 [Polyangiaceae bacterium]|nr:hypothetical protein [Polyangiaceae bacterium]